jgi:pimeloyl-ACP methyl ester carboxylesterase
MAEMKLLKSLLLGTASLTLASAAACAVEPFPAQFRTLDIQTEGAVIHVRIGGQGPAVVLLHGFGATGDMWSPLAAELVHDHTVIAPDLRGMGLSSHPEHGYDKKTQARDIEHVLSALHVQRVDLVTYDIGNMVGYAFVVQHQREVRHWVMAESGLPGIGDWDRMKCAPGAWHFNFYGVDEERLVAGRERIYLDRFWNEKAATPARIDEATRRHYAALYARPHAMHDAFNQFKTFPRDAADNQRFLAQYGKLDLPILAIGGDHSYGDKVAAQARAIGNDVTPVVIRDAGHWLMEEQPDATMAAIRAFLDRPQATQAMQSPCMTLQPTFAFSGHVGFDESFCHDELPPSQYPGGYF